MVCQNDESLALMITSIRLPAVLPPLPPLEPLAPAEVARPATTPTTTASSAIAATSDSENFTRRMSHPFNSKRFEVPYIDEYRAAMPRLQRVINDHSECATLRCKRFEEAVDGRRPAAPTDDERRRDAGRCELEHGVSSGERRSRPAA